MFTMMANFDVQRVQRHPKGFYVAEVLVGDEIVRIDNATGSWTFPANPAEDPSALNVARREVIGAVKDKAQAMVRQMQDGADGEQAPRQPRRRFN